MNDETKKYICKLPTNGHQVGDEVFMTEAEAANANGGEAEPRFVLAVESQASSQTTTEAAAGSNAVPLKYMVIKEWGGVELGTTFTADQIGSEGFLKAIGHEELTKLVEDGTLEVVPQQ